MNRYLCAVFSPYHLMTYNNVFLLHKQSTFLHVNNLVLNLFHYDHYVIVENHSAASFSNGFQASGIGVSRGRLSEAGGFYLSKGDQCRAQEGKDTAEVFEKF